LSFGSCSFGLGSYLWFRVGLALRGPSILESRVWFLAGLRSTQFNYHYLTMICVFMSQFYLWKQSTRFPSRVRCIFWKFSCQINIQFYWTRELIPSTIVLVISFFFAQHCLMTCIYIYQSRIWSFHNYVVLEKQTETKPMSKQSFWLQNTKLIQLEAVTTGMPLISVSSKRLSWHHFNFYNKDYHPFINILKKVKCFSLVSMLRF